MNSSLVKTPMLQRNLAGSKSTSGGVLCSWGDQTFAPTSWACKKQTAVSHSTEAEVISLDTGLRMEELHASTLWDILIDASEPHVSGAGAPSRQPRPKASNTTQGSVDHVLPIAPNSSNRAHLFLFFF